MCPGCVGTENPDEDVNVNDDDFGQPSPLSSIHSPPGLSAQTLRHRDKQQQHQQPQCHQQPRHHQQQQHKQHLQVPVPHLSHRRQRKGGSVANGMSGGSDKSMMFGYEMANLWELSLEDLMALRTKCGRWL